MLLPDGLSEDDECPLKRCFRLVKTFNLHQQMSQPIQGPSGECVGLAQERLAVSAASLAKGMASRYCFWWLN